MSSPELADLPFFKELTLEESAKARNIFNKRSCPAGALVMAEGEMGHEMFLLLHGTVQISKAMLLEGMTVPLLQTDSPRKVLATVNEDMRPMLGEVALIDSDERSATVRALTDCEFLVTSREAFFDLLRREPEVGVKLLLTIGRRMAKTIRRTNAEVVKLTTALALSLRKGL
jgi:CRP-like cAMP-binding protein